LGKPHWKEWSTDHDVFTSNAGDFSNGMNTPQATDSFLGENCTEEHMVLILEHGGGVAASLD